MEDSLADVKAVLFDLDDTLYDRESAIGAVAHAQYLGFRDCLPGVTEAGFVERFLAVDNHGYCDKSRLFRTLAAEWRLGADTAEAMHRQFWEMLYRSCRLPEDALATLLALRERGRKLGVITNGLAVTQRRKLEGLGIAELLDAVVVSEAEGIAKPEPEIFLRACARCGVRPQEAVYVGDNPETDITGAVAAGLIPVLKLTSYRSVTVPGVLAIRRLSEILPLCLDGRQNQGATV